MTVFALMYWKPLSRKRERGRGEGGRAKNSIVMARSTSSPALLPLAGEGSAAPSPFALRFVANYGKLNNLRIELTFLGL